MKTYQMIRSLLLCGIVSLSLSACGGGGGGGGDSADYSSSSSASGNSSQGTVGNAPSSLASGMEFEFEGKEWGDLSIKITGSSSFTYGSYTYTNTGANTGTLRLKYNDEDWDGLEEIYTLTFTDWTKGNYTANDSDNDSDSGTFTVSGRPARPESSESSSSSSGSSSSSSGSGSSASGSGSTNSATEENIAPNNLAGIVFRGSGNEFYSFSSSGMTYSFGSSVDQRYTGGGYSYKRTGPTTGTLSYSNASYRGGYLPYYEYTVTHSSAGTVDLTFKSSGGKLTVSMSGKATTTTKTTDRTSIPYKTTSKTTSSTISGTFNVEQ